MKKNTILIVLMMLAGLLQAQSEIKDPEAKEILDKLSEETKSYKTISAGFSFTMENQQEDITETYDGTVKIKGTKYRLSLMGTETYCNGSTIWTHLKESEEVNITNRNLEDKSFLNNPSALFSMYEDGYKYVYKGDVKKNEVTYAQIELYPEKVDQGLEPGENGSNDLSKIRMLINTDKNRIFTFTYFTKDGNVYTIKIKDLVPNNPMSDSEFTFDTKKHPNVEVIDLRDE